MNNQPHGPIGALWHPTADSRPEIVDSSSSPPRRTFGSNSEEIIRRLFDEYLVLYSSRDDRLTTLFSENFSGFAGGGNVLVKDRAEWIRVTRQDFAQVKDPIRIEIKDLAIQCLAETVAVATGFFTIHLPIKDHILSRETARLVLIFGLESAGWRISHSSISIPYHLVREGEVYPLEELVERNHFLEKSVAERTAQLSEANRKLSQSNAELATEIAERKETSEALQRSEERYRSILNASPDDITITDREGRIVMVSPMAIRMFGTETNQQYLGQPVIDFLVPEDRPRALAQMALKQKGVTTGANEYQALRKDGTTFHVEVNSEFIRDAAGSPSGMVIVVRDITARKQAELERERLIRELRDAMASLKTLSGLLPICANCKKIRDDAGYWNRIESYISRHSEATFSHGLCPDCAHEFLTEAAGAHEHPESH